MIEITPYLGVLVTLTCLLGSVLVSWGVTKATIHFNSESIKSLKTDLAGMREEMGEVAKTYRSALYGPDGVTIFTPRRICNEMRQDCSDRFCQKVEEVKEIAREDKKELNANLLANRDLIIRQYEEMLRFMGRVDEHLKLRG